MRRWQAFLIGACLLWGGFYLMNEVMKLEGVIEENRQWTNYVAVKTACAEGNQRACLIAERLER